MELLYELLREACSCFLLFFLVVRIISLIVSTSDDDSSSFSGFVKDDLNRKNQLQIDGYNNLVDDDDAETHNKSIKFLDQNLEVEDTIDEDLPEGFVEEVDDQDVSKLVEIGGEFVDHEKGIVGFQDNGKNSAVADEIGGEFVDHEKKIVGFQDNGKIGGEFVDDEKRIVGFRDNGINSAVADEIGGREEVDGNGDELDASSILTLGEGSSNVCRGEVSGRELDDEGVLSDEQEWEGIETSELEKSFARAMNWVGCKVNQDLLVSKLGNDVMMQFYGLHKIAMEGTCHEIQPLAIKRAARAKWNAWQKLGSMTREDAMEQYISLLSDIVPEWKEEDSTIIMMKGKSSSSTTALDSSAPEAN